MRCKGSLVSVRCIPTPAMTITERTCSPINVNKRSDLLRVIIPFFREYPLRTAKRLDFDKFAFCVEKMTSGHHLTPHGLADLLEVMETMNRRKPRTELIRILRGHTPGPETSGEDMVPSAWRH